MVIFKNQPLFVLMLGLTSLSMYIPVFFSARLDQWLYARTFFYHGTFFLIICVLLGIAFSSKRLQNKIVSNIFDLFCCFVILPMFMAAPLNHLVINISFFDAYFEMLSSFTTTGASIFDNNDKIPDVIHLWRALIAWFGGLLMLIAALSIFQPAGLGGFDVYMQKQNLKDLKTQIKRANVRSRIFKYTILISPVYFFLTILMSILLIISGDRPLVAVIHSMSTFSTSGISNVNGIDGTNSGIIGEMIIVIFLIFSISRFMYQQDSEGKGYRRLKRDKEVNIMLLLIVSIPSLLFMRHWFGAIDISENFDFFTALSAFWGGVFMVMSFLTTTGFESKYWNVSQAWSGLGTPGIILMGLSVLGGGIATTAGGVKLLRVYVLYKHGVREMTRLSYPHSVAGAGNKARSFRREGAYAAWIFFMLFIVSLAMIILGFSFSGITFENSLILAISGLSTIGPLVNVAGDGTLYYSNLSDLAKAIFCIAMVFGRLEALAVIALFNPNYWLK